MRALLLLLFIALPVHAHHTPEHVLSPPAAVAKPQPAESGANLWLALGPFFALAAIGALRWGYRRYREQRQRD
jgi:hypothetical protein